MAPKSTRRIGIYAGSFDPVTMGHVDVVARGSKLFDHVIVAVGQNVGKSTMFTLEERLGMLRETMKGYRNVSVEAFSGLLINFAQDRGATAIIRGLRAVTDFDYEFQIGLTNMDLNPAIETIFLLTNPHNIFISSSMVKEIARFGGDVSPYLPPASRRTLKKKLKQLGL